jgi:hypothetical protein
MLSLSHEVRLTVLVPYRIRRSFHPLMYLMAEQSKAWVCSRSPAGIAGSNPAGGMDVCLL